LREGILNRKNYNEKGNELKPFIIIDYKGKLN